MRSPTFTHDVFLSYSSKDKAVVHSIAKQLQADGLRVWLDSWEVMPGDNIPVKIEDGLEHSRVLVLCMSTNAFHADWVTLESQTFRFRDPLNKARRFIPLRLDDCNVRGSLAQFRYIDWFAEGREAAYANLLEACRASSRNRGREGRGQAGYRKNRPFDQYPAEVRGMLREAEKCEVAGDVWSAERYLVDACATLRNSGQGSDQQLATLQMRAHVNHTLAEQLRREYRGTPGPTLVKVFDEFNRFQYTATKSEVHSSAGLIHHTAILLVRDGEGRVVYYLRQPGQTGAGKWDFFGGHTADVDNCPMDTARREANEELQLFLNDRRLHVADEWIHQIGDDHRFVWHAPQNRERSTLFIVELPSHPALKLRITDEAEDGLRVLTIPGYETALLHDLVSEYRSGNKVFADCAERILIEYCRDADLRAKIDSWFATADPSTASQSS